MPFNPLHSLRLLPLLLCVSLSVFAQGNQPIGTVLAATGAVTARDAAGTVRNLVRKSEIFVHDTILVGADGFAQIKMADSAKIKFNPNTEFAFNEYSFDGNPDTPDTALMTMVKGGFRAISGSVGHGKGDDYRVDTPYASIGIRGTTHEALLDGGMLYTGVYEGGTTISNNQGSINTGINANYDFTLTTQGQPPQGLLVQPAVLANMQVNIADINTTKAATSAGTIAAADSSSNSDAGSNSNNGSNSNSGSSTTAATASTNNTAADQNGQGNAAAPASAAANTATAGGTAAATAAATAPAASATNNAAAATTTSAEDGRTRLAAVINNIDRGAGSASGVGTTTTPALPASAVRDVEVITVIATPATTAATTASAPATSNLNPVLNKQSAQELATASTGKTVATASSGASNAPASTATASTSSGTATSGNNSATAGASDSATSGASNSATAGATNSNSAGSTASSSTGKQDTGTSTNAASETPVVSVTDGKTTVNNAATTTQATTTTIPAITSTDKQDNGNSASTNNSSSNGNSDSKTTGSSSNGNSDSKTTGSSTANTASTIPAISSTDKQDSSTGTNASSGNGNSDSKTTVSSGNGSSDSKTTGSSTANTTTIPAVSSTDKQVSSTGTNTSSGNGNSDSKTTASSGNGNSDSKITVSSGIGNSDSKTTVSSGNGNSDRKTTVSSGSGNSDSKTTGSSNDRNEAASSTTIRSTSSLTTGDLQSLSYWDVDVRGALQSLVGEASTRNYLGSITLPYTKAVDISNKTGSLSYSSNSFAGTDELGAALKNVQMSFLLDLAGGSIRNGNLVVEDASRIKWTVTFAGSAGGSGASMTGLDGKLSGGGKVTSGSIQGVFVGASAKPDMIAAFNLQAGTNKVEGLVGLSP